MYVCTPCAFSALTLLVGWQEGHPACESWVMRYWHSYLSAARCKWFAYGPADASATPSSLAPVKSRMVYLSGAGLPRLSWKKCCQTDVVLLVVVILVLMYTMCQYNWPNFQSSLSSVVVCVCTVQWNLTCGILYPYNFPLHLVMCRHNITWKYINTAEIMLFSSHKCVSVSKITHFM